MAKKKRKSERTTTTTPPPPSSFDQLGASSELCEALASMNIKTPFEAQVLSWSWLRDSASDVAILAEAGSGKTVAYLGPLIERLRSEKSRGRKHELYIVVPNRELENQVMKVATCLGSAAKLKVALDGSPGSRSADIVIGTAAKLVSSLNFKQPVARTVVVDEADLLLAGTTGKKKGGATTAAPAEQIIAKALKLRSRITKDAIAANVSKITFDMGWPRIVVASATLPGLKGKSVGNYLGNKFPLMKWVRTGGAHKPVEKLSSEFLTVENRTDRDKHLLRLCKSRKGRTIVFGNGAPSARRAYNTLVRSYGNNENDIFICTPDVPAEDRETDLEKFSKSRRGILISSGLAGRGLDLPHVDLVIEYDVAKNLVDHMHRVGRTARAGREGRAVSFISPDVESDAKIQEEMTRCRNFPSAQIYY